MRQHKRNNLVVSPTRRTTIRRRSLPVDGRNLLPHHLFLLVVGLMMMTELFPSSSSWPIIRFVQAEDRPKLSDDNRGRVLLSPFLLTLNFMGLYPTSFNCNGTDAESLRSDTEDCVRTYAQTYCLMPTTYIGLGNPSCPDPLTPVDVGTAVVLIKGGVFDFTGYTEHSTAEVNACIQQAVISSTCLLNYQSTFPTLGSVQYGLNTLPPSLQPSPSPSRSFRPTSTPVKPPSSWPTKRPTPRPSLRPSLAPSGQPSLGPTGGPSVLPSTRPSFFVSNTPSASPAPSSPAPSTPQPSALPSGSPSGRNNTNTTTSTSSTPTDNNHQKVMIMGASIAAGFLLVAFLTVSAASRSPKHAKDPTARNLTAGGPWPWSLVAGVLASRPTERETNLDDDDDDYGVDDEATAMQIQKAKGLGQLDSLHALQPSPADEPTQGSAHARSTWPPSLLPYHPYAMRDDDDDDQDDGLGQASITDRGGGSLSSSLMTSAAIIAGAAASAKSLPPGPAADDPESSMHTSVEVIIIEDDVDDEQQRTNAATAVESKYAVQSAAQLSTTAAAAAALAAKSNHYPTYPAARSVSSSRTADGSPPRKWMYPLALSLKNPFGHCSPDKKAEEDDEDDRGSDSSSQINKIGTDYEPDREWDPDDTSFTSEGDGFAAAPIVMSLTSGSEHSQADMGDEASLMDGSRKHPFEMDPLPLPPELKNRSRAPRASTPRAFLLPTI